MKQIISTRIVSRIVREEPASDRQPFSPESITNIPARKTAAYYAAAASNYSKLPDNEYSVWTLLMLPVGLIVILALVFLSGVR